MSDVLRAPGAPARAQRSSLARTADHPFRAADPEGNEEIMTITEPIDLMPGMGPALTDTRRRRTWRTEPVPADDLLPLALLTRAASVRGCLDEAAEAAARYESLLQHHLRDRIADDAGRGRVMSTAEQRLVADLLRQARRMVVAALVRDDDGAARAESVAVLTERYSRGLRARAALARAPVPTHLAPPLAVNDAKRRRSRPMATPGPDRTGAVDHAAGPRP